MAEGIVEGFVKKSFDFEISGVRVGNFVDVLAAVGVFAYAVKTVADFLGFTFF